jgi:hypothetical protein
MSTPLLPHPNNNKKQKKTIKQQQQTKQTNKLTKK